MHAQPKAKRIMKRDGIQPKPQPGRHSKGQPKRQPEDQPKSQKISDALPAGGAKCQPHNRRNEQPENQP